MKELPELTALFLVVLKEIQSNLILEDLNTIGGFDDITFNKRKSKVRLFYQGYVIIVRLLPQKSMSNLYKLR